MKLNNLVNKRIAVFPIAVLDVVQYLYSLTCNKNINKQVISNYQL